MGIDNPILQNIVNALSGGAQGSIPDANFFAEHTLDSKWFQVEVDGVGLLPNPLTAESIKALLEISSLAKYGLRDKTLLDTQVRNTQEIPASRIRIKADEKLFAKMLDDLRSNLGLSPENKLTAHLHNMLIYGPGQFFKGHKDTEKCKGMIASLVVTLPYPHIGGAFTISHGEAKHEFITENLNAEDIKCIAFYADCLHAVEKVTQGYRVALTYNLVLESSGVHVESNPNPQLDMAFSEYFQLESQEDLSTSPIVLVYFLDHQYTKANLHWGQLKGADYHNAMALKAAAKRLNLIAHLSLAESHESWSTDDEEYSGNPEPDELESRETMLSDWIDANNLEVPYCKYSMDEEEEACGAIDTKDLEPDRTEHGGYMGNYSAPVEYWYRRSAVVLWRADDQTAMDFKLNYAQNLKFLVEMANEPGREVEVATIIKNAGNALYSCKPNNSEHFESFAKISCYLKDEEFANLVLSTFMLNTIVDKTLAKPLANLQDLYGTPWLLQLLDACSKVAIHYYSDQQSWSSLSETLQVFTSNGVDIQAVEFILQNKFDEISKSDKSDSRAAPERLHSRLESRLKNLKELLKACELLPDNALTYKVSDHLIAHSVLYQPMILAKTLLELKQNAAIAVARYVTLVGYITDQLKQELDEGPRDLNDWSIKIKLPCKCERCKVVSDFLASKTEPERIWPLIQGGRDHVSEVCRSQCLPIELSVVKAGSPHKLIMRKDLMLHQKAKQRFDTLRLYYDQLADIACNNGSVMNSVLARQPDEGVITRIDV